MVYGSGVGVFATSHGAQPVGDPCIDDGVAADCQLGGFLVQFADHPCGHRQRDSLLQRGMMFDYGIAEIDIAEDVVAVVEHLLKLVAGDRLGIIFAFMACLLVLARSAHGYDADALAAFGCNRRPMPAVDHPEHDVAHIVVSGIRGGQRHWRRRAGRQDRGLPRTTIRVLILDSILVIYKSVLCMDKRYV